MKQLISVMLLSGLAIFLSGCNLPKHGYIGKPPVVPIEVVETKLEPEFKVTEQMMVDGLNRDIMMLYMINDMEKEFDSQLALMGKVLLMYKEELEKRKSCECQNKQVED